MVLVLVIGPQDWGIPHYGGLVGGPLLIYGVRQAITTAFGWSISRQQSHVDRLQKQREQKITELKKATKYDSTQELLQKYGGAPPKPKEEDQKQGTKTKGKGPQPQAHVQRTGLSPPPTANIQTRGSPAQAARPHTPTDRREPRAPQSIVQGPIGIDEPGFAPNAFAQAPPSRSSYEHTSHWYDRILDVMLGEDETLAKNRLALLCQNCRLVNGQAPPGVKTPEELGKWRCQSCGAWNGVQAEATKMVQEMAGVAPASPTAEPTSEEEEDHHAEVKTLDGGEGATGRDKEDDSSGVSKRTTRSTGKPELDGL